MKTMMCEKLAIAIILLVITDSSLAQVDTGAGTVYTLKIVEDVCLERPTSNFNYLQWLIVGFHAQYPKKRSLLKFQDLPASCGTVNYAMMYLYYAYSHKASWQSVYTSPFISRTIQAHRVLKPWKESQATSSVSQLNSPNWASGWLGLDDTDANDCPTGEVTIHATTPHGFVEIEVTTAVKDWKNGKPNYGLVIWATNEDQNGRDTRFYSNAYTDSSKHAFIRVNCD